jgi:hypothetical protein
MIPDLNQPSRETAALAYRIFPSFYEVITFLEADIDGKQ